MGPPGRPPGRWPHIALGLYLATALVCLVWPVYPALGRVEPLVLGLPFHFAYVVAWALVTPVVLGLYMRATEDSR